MDIQLFNNLSQTDRAQALKDNCDVIETTSYMKRFTPDEIQAQKERLSEVSIIKNDIEEEKKMANQAYDAKIKPFKSEIKDLLVNIKQKARLVNEEVYKFVDHEAGEVGYYNSEGDLINQRPILPNERQTNIFPFKSASSGN